MYLGDGHISPGPREVYRLRIYLDAKYPRVVAECRAAIHACMPDNKVSSTGNRSNFRNDRARTAVVLYSYSKQWATLIPQHGPGKSTSAPSSSRDGRKT